MTTELAAFAVLFAVSFTALVLACVALRDINILQDRIAEIEMDLKTRP